MIKYASLCRELLTFVKNGVMSHVACKQALQDLWLLRPALVSKVKNPGTFALELSGALRGLLTWWREYRKGKTSLLKKATASDEVPGLPKFGHPKTGMGI